MEIHSPMRTAVAASDIGWAGVAVVLGLALASRRGAADVHAAVALWIPLALAWLGIGPWLRLSARSAGPRDFAVLAAAAGLAIALAAAATYAATNILSGRQLLRVWLLFIVGLAVIRMAAAGWCRTRKQRTIILGSGPLAREVGKRILRHPGLGWDLIGFLGIDAAMSETSNRECLRTPQLQRLLQEEAADQILVALDGLPPEVLTFLEEVRAAGVRVVRAASDFALYSCSPRMHDLDGIPLLEYLDWPKPRWALTCKRLLDVALAAAVVIITLPLTLCVAVVAKVRFGCALDGVVRVGRRGTEFRMYRFRWADVGPRHALRRSGLRELPQMLNVLRGEMSLVGPRPEPPEQARRYVGPSSRRMELRPGITGLAQIHGLGEAQAMSERHSYDLEYAGGWSLRKDIDILFRTGLAVGQRIIRGRVRPPDLPWNADTGSGRERAC